MARVCLVSAISELKHAKAQGQIEAGKGLSDVLSALAGAEEHCQIRPYSTALKHEQIEAGTCLKHLLDFCMRPSSSTQRMIPEAETMPVSARTKPLVSALTQPLSN